MKISYTGRLDVTVCCRLDGQKSFDNNLDFGQFPIMVKVCSVFLRFRSLKLIKFYVCLN
jgi:hypothetical protein